jgi:predicted RecA/RadA family phage recombinase
MASGDRANFSGDLVFTAPTGGVIRGQIYKILETYIVARETVSATLPFLGAIQGAVTIEKVTGTGKSFAVGDAVYYVSASKKVTPSSTGNTLVGKAIAAAGISATSVDVLLTQSEV